MNPLFLLLYTAFLFGAVNSDRQIALSGTIKDAASLTPLARASVKILKNRELVKSAFADANGNYRFELESGAYDVECAHPGYVTLRLTGVQVAAERDNTLAIMLESSASLEETVVRDINARPEMYRLHGDVSVAEMAMISVSERKTDGLAPARVGKDMRMAKREERTKALSSKSAATKAKDKSAAEPAIAPATTAPPAEVVVYEPVKPDGAVDKARVVYEPETYEEKIIISDDETVAPPPGGPAQPAPRAGLLTAGEWNDLHNWNRHWTDLLADGEIEQYQTMYGFFPQQRHTVWLTNEQDFPLADAVVQLKSGGEIVWEARSDNTGKAELWAGLFDKKEAPNLEIDAWVNGKKHDLGHPKSAKDGPNIFKINAECTAPKNVDIVWAVDATGSMGDEIEYLKTELLDVIGRAKSRNPGLAFRMGTVFYRDLSDAYITKSSGLSTDIGKTVDFIKKQNADGGGDYPEAVHSALEEAVFGQKWSENAIARICFLVLDASPHQSPEVNAGLQKSIREAARLGIRIVPVTASGIQKDTEFLMKFFGLATNGTYVFLTDHSGIGEKHLEPTTDEYKVEPLNELLVRLITEYTTIETCEGKSQILFADDPQQQGQTWQALYYPNPATTQFTLELPFDVQSVTIYDSEGKAVRKLEKPQGGQHNVVVSDLDGGFYTIRILKDGRMQSGKLVVVRV